MSEDVVERLKAYAGYTSYPTLRNLLTEAAAEITRLRASRNAVVEECAKVAVNAADDFMRLRNDAQPWRDSGMAYEIIKAIRALKSPSPPEDGNGESNADA